MRPVKWLLFSISLMLALVGILAWLAQGPDRELRFTREVYSTTPRAKIEQTLFQTSRWPGWFHSLASADLEEGTQSLALGRLVTLRFDTHRSPWSKFQIGVQVVEVTSDRLTLRVVEDSKGRLQGLFDPLEWTIELIAQGNGTLIRGKSVARTIHWRSRLFGRLAERTFMNQLFYPNLMALSDIKPLDVQVLPPTNWNP